MVMIEYKDKEYVKCGTIIDIGLCPLKQSESVIKCINSDGINNQLVHPENFRLTNQFNLLQINNFLVSEKQNIEDMFREKVSQEYLDESCLAEYH